MSDLGFLQFKVVRQHVHDALCGHRFVRHISDEGAEVIGCHHLGILVVKYQESQ